MRKSKIYFASDFHLGIPNHSSSLIREKKLVSWLDLISKDATEIFLMGDVFDFWFEFRHVIPKGYVRLLGKIAEITDKGIPVHLFKGNHDIWAFDYFSKEVNVELHRKPIIREIDGYKFLLAHGDGLGPGDTGYKLLKKVFEFKPNQFMLKLLHPDIVMWMGLYFSKRSRYANNVKEGNPKNKVKVEDEMLVQYAKRKVTANPDIDFIVFGHRHIPLQEKIGVKTQMTILGDWITHFSYSVFEDGKMRLEYFED